MKRFVILSVVLLCFALSCKDNKAEANPDQNGDADAVSTNLDNALLLKLVNQVRASGCNCGTMAMPPVPALSWSNVIAKAAYHHSSDMNKNNFFTHVSSDGKTLSDRFDAVGYPWKAIAENIAKGQKDEQTVMNSWLSSEGHCKNIMSANYKEMGTARVGSYWTQDFGARR
ncbi:CAP domain-containing protein [Pedobacter sp. KR3-3]|uniref:CAP domain-containing protein n=1 Tax=Pedobacter albus TaxID=3113905 RepID=A0ABU7I7R2_9SPHI|nr:CAP domain-containing protein [Pedobacter sp. KR3-3]MEE1945424.1 CAP domain-containing protein [Pedobacter sp. KR3-3]